jgi:hypothetical protein
MEKAAVERALRAIDQSAETSNQALAVGAWSTLVQTVMRADGRAIWPWKVVPKHGSYEVRTCFGGHFIVGELSKADASLIAAAPDLFMSLTTIIDRWNRDGNVTRGFIEQAQQAAERAIGIGGRS